MNQRGLWICIDAPDYTGKKRQSVKIVSQLLDWSEDNIVTVTHEPSRRAQEIKRALAKDPDPYSNGMKLAELYTDDRVQNENNVILPLLDQGGIVISNRHKYSTDAYQSAQGITMDDTIALQKRKGIHTPDITIFLLASPSVVAERMRLGIAERGGVGRDKFERDLDFQKRVADQYRVIAARASSDPEYFGNVHIVDANPGIDEVARTISSIVGPVYSTWLRSYTAGQGS